MFTLKSAGRTLDLETVAPLRVTLTEECSVEELNERLSEDGYLYLTGLLDRERVLAVGQHLYRKLAALELLDPEAPVEEGRARKGANCAFMPELANGDPVVENLLYDEALPAFFSELLGGPACHYDYTWLRVVAPGRGTHPHMDFVYMGRGTDQVYTAWTPLGDVDLQIGGLMMLEGSHRSSLVRDYGHLDVDAQCEGGGPSPMERAGFLASGAITDDPVQLQAEIGGRWLTSNFRAGDVLIFGMFIAHASLDNQSDRIRLSTDCRFQRADLPIDGRWVGPEPPGHSVKVETIC